MVSARSARTTSRTCDRTRETGGGIPGALASPGRHSRLPSPSSSVTHSAFRERSLPLEHDPVDPSSTVVRDVERAVRPFRHSHRAVQRRRRQRSRGAREAIGERLPLARRTPVRIHGNERDLIALVRERRAVEAAVEGDEGAAMVPLRELVARVEVQSVRRPVRTEVHERHVVARAVDVVGPAADDRPVSAVLRREDLPAEGRIRRRLRADLGVVEVAVRPPGVAPAAEVHELLRRKYRIVLLRVELRPVLEELVASVRYAIELAIARIDGERDAVADARRPPLAIALRLVRAARVEAPYAGAD